MAWSMVGKGLQASYDAKIKGWNDELDYYLVYVCGFSTITIHRCTHFLFCDLVQYILCRLNGIQRPSVPFTAGTK